MYIRLLERIVSRYGPSRILSFSTAHVLKTLQLLQQNEYVSRAKLSKDLALGEGSIKTLIKHLKVNGIINTTKAGCYLTGKGKKLCANFLSVIPNEISIPMNSITIGNYNYAVLLRGYAFAVATGLEQRDSVIRFGGQGATTLLFRDSKFVMPRTDYDCLKKEPDMRNLLISKLSPQEDDVIIIGSASDRITAELGAKSAALFTIASHERHEV
jgi:biotin operon repressor